jgi:hypothetical protein
MQPVDAHLPILGNTHTYLHCLDGCLEQFQGTPSQVLRHTN